jgi:formate hydrogenlyase subunit 3/multisubunit Na+/H+ antiporter MnhD subunit
VLAPLAGAIATMLTRDLHRARRVYLGSLGLTLAAASAAALDAHLGGYGERPLVLGAFAIDGVAAPLLPVIGMLQLLVALGTSKVHTTHAGSVRLLLATLFALAAATAVSGPVLIGAMTAAAALPAWDLHSRGRSLRAYLVYMVPALGLLIAGWVGLGASPGMNAGLMAAGLLIYCGMAPGHGWAPALFESGRLGSALAFVLPILPVMAVMRLLLPSAPADVLAVAGWACLFTGVYAGGLALVQDSVRRFYGWLVLSQLSMVMFAALQATPAGLTAALCLWISAALSLAGLAFPVRGLEARFGALSIREHHGLYAQAPTLAVCFLIAGLGCAGFPGAIGFVPVELLVSGSFEQGWWVSAVLAFIAMLNGIAVLRAYFSLFTGKRVAPSVSLQATRVERVGIAAVVVVVLLGGWLAPDVVASRHSLADQILIERAATTP